MTKTPAAIEARGISMHFGDHTVLEDISFGALPGRICGLLGPSGAGKTTLIRILTGQLAPASGTPLLEGRPVESWSAPQRAAGIGVMMDDQGLYERFSCAENLALTADLCGVPKTRAQEALEMVGLGAAAKKKAHVLSKGMRSRLNLARALMKGSNLLFLDEPTAGLDPGSAAEIRDILVARKKAGACIFLSTHDMHEAAAICDDLMLLNDGKIVESGTPRNILRRFDRLQRLRVVMADGHEVLLTKDAAGAAELGRLLEDGKVEAVHSTEPTLEDVFLERTGRRMRDDA